MVFLWWRHFWIAPNCTKIELDCDIFQNSDIAEHLWTAVSVNKFHTFPWQHHSFVIIKVLNSQQTLKYFKQYKSSFWCAFRTSPTSVIQITSYKSPVDTGRNFNVHTTFRRRPVSTGKYRKAAKTMPVFQVKELKWRC